MIVQEILTAPSNDPREELDAILAELCELAINSHKKDPEYYGLVASCVICPDGQRIYGVNHEKDGLRIHAERDALDRCADPGPECIVVTTCSPCNTGRNPNHMERYGEDCQDLLDQYGIEHVYCGYKNPEEEPDSSIETQNPKIRELCKLFAGTFLKENINPTTDSGTVQIKSLVDAVTRLEAELRSNPTQFDREEYYRKKNLLRQYKKNIQNLIAQHGVTENFADGRVKGKSRPGRVKRAGASCNGSVTDLRAKAKKASGERARMYHWCANMKSGKKK